MSTLHILGSAVLPIHSSNTWDAFGIAILKFIRNMKERGWNCIHYGVEGCEVECETIICAPAPCDALASVSLDPKIKAVCNGEYNRRAAIEIGKRKQPNDVILCFYGYDNKVAAETHSDLLIVEPAIGYSIDAVFAPFRVFTSYAQMHLYYGKHGVLNHPSWFDAVIPNGFTPSDFEFNTKKEDYILYFGRVIELKGLNVAIQATERSGHKLIVAGPGDLASLGYTDTPKHVTQLGVCDAVQRKELMKNAKAIIGPTYYVEPFGNMVVEGYFSGTPAITTDWGGFVDTVKQGVTGFRCREMREFVFALNHIDWIEPNDCLTYAMENYHEDIVHEQFDTYLKKVIARDFYRV